jgi:hypothetical protein
MKTAGNTVNEIVPKPRRYAVGHRLFIEYGEMQRDLIRICRQPPKAVSLIRAMSREFLRANRKRQFQKPVSHVRIMPGAHFRGGS